MERMFTENDQLAIQRAVFADTSEFNKTHFARAVQELTLTNSPVVLEPATEADFKELLQGLMERIVALKPKAVSLGK